MAQPTRSRVYISWFFIAFFVLLLFPTFFYSQPVGGLDPSWNVALCLAYKYHLVFGRDFIFTYGPLGVLHTRLPISINLFEYLLFDIYFVVSVFFVLKAIFKKHFSYGLVIISFLIITIALYEALYQWYFFFFLFHLFSFLRDSKKTMHIVQAALMSLICFYYKVNLGVVAILILLVTLTYALLRKQLNWRKYVVVLAAFFFITWLSARLLSVDLYGYVAASLQIIEGYNDAMFRELSGPYVIFLYATLLIIVLMAAWMIQQLVKAWKEKAVLQQLDDFFIYGIVALAVFVVFKSGFVRSDGHIYIFFKSAGMLAALLFLFSPEAGRKRAAACCWAVVIISFWAVNAIPGSYKPYKRILNGSFLAIRADELKTYFHGLQTYNQALADTYKPEHSTNELKSIIGDHSVDVVPTEIAKVYFNGLRYNPRPVIQSYSAYTGYLDSLNYQKYISSTAPDYIIFTVENIDDRAPGFDESKTKMALLTHYEVVKNVGNDLLLKKRDVPVPLLKSAGEQVTTVKMGEEIPIQKSSALQYTKIAVQYNLWGGLQRLFYKPPLLKITFTLETGEQQTFRAIKPILDAGVLINKYIDSKEEFQVLLQSGGRLNSTVKSIRFESEPANSGFNPTIQMTNSWYSFGPKSPEQAIADSTGLAKLVQENNQYKPIPVAASTLIADSFPFGIGEYKTHSQIIMIDGWAYRPTDRNDNHIVKTVLEQNGQVYEMPTEVRSRPDIVQAFERKDIEHNGFMSRVSRFQLPPGVYRVGLTIEDTLSKKRWVGYSDRTITIKAAATE